MNRLEIRLLGGFEVRVDGRVVTTFESQKSRGLLAYLALHRGQEFPRERLANLLWSERPEESARRNLRQALYSIRSALSPKKGDLEIFASDHRTLGLDPELDVWIDVEAFREAARLGSTERGHDPTHLAAAVRLYRGDLLTGFFPRDCPSYEEWLLGQQEGLRDEAVEALRTLVGAYLGRGESRFGIQYAKRLLAIDPLSEEAHRQLMRLYLVAGRRNSALAHYERLKNLLNEELGVEPLEETAELYRSILLEAHEREEQTKPAPVGPLIPLVARSEAFAELRRAWGRVLEGSGRLTLVVGSRGVGKTRAMRSFVDVATSRRHAVVLRARCFRPSPLVSYKPFAEMISSAFADVLLDEEATRGRLEPPTLERLVSMAPDTAPVLLESIGTSVVPGATDAEQSRRGVLELLDALSEPGSPDARPVILLIDDLHCADPPSLELIEALLPDLATRRVWFLATADPDAESSSLLRDARPSGTENVDRIRLDPLGEDDVGELANSLVEPESAGVLAGFLWSRSQGLPLMLAELINFLWDTGVLVALAPGQWRLTGDPGQAVAFETDLADLVRQRFERLPASARRLLALAAVSGQQFDVESLRLAGDEHIAVVEICVELALERWLIRQHPRRWSHAGMQQDLVLWARGARRGFFEFAHRAVREAILGSINPLRRQIMHRDVARAVLEQNGADTAAVCESLALHETGAGEPERALPWLEQAAERAEASGGILVAETYRERARAAIDRLLAAANDSDARRELEKRAARLSST